MRKIYTTTALCLIATFSFAQMSFQALDAVGAFPTDPAITVTSEGAITNTTVVSNAPDAIVTFSRGLSTGTQAQDRLFDKSMIWFYKTSFHSYDKIISSDKAAGIIVGRSFFYSAYNVPSKKDSTKAFDYTNYNFEWTIKIENGQVNYTINNIYVNKNVFLVNNINQKTPVTMATKIPFSVLLSTDEKMQKDWNLSRSYLINNLDAMVISLNKELATDDDLNWKF